MPAHSESRSFPYATDKLYALVADVENYPVFLPWCRAARILQRFDDGFTAELIISFKGLTEQYTSRITLTPPAGDHANCRIDVELVSGPFHHLSNHWSFAPNGADTQVEFSLDFQFKTKLLDMLIGQLFSKATQKMVEAFSARAHALYGERN